MNNKRHIQRQRDIQRKQVTRAGNVIWLLLEWHFHSKQHFLNTFHFTTCQEYISHVFPTLSKVFWKDW